jgi:hypothetical protein
MNEDIQYIMDEIEVGRGVASELLEIADDPDLVIDASRRSRGLDQCKARIIGSRFASLEDWLYLLEERIGKIEGEGDDDVREGS